MNGADVTGGRRQGAVSRRGVAAIGEETRVGGFVLAGVTVLTTDRDGPEGAWELLPDDTGLVVLTPTAYGRLEPRLRERPRLLWTVMPT